MRLSKRTEYGLRAIVQLARLWPNELVQSRDLAKSENLPGKFLEAILLTLRRGGFLESKVGSGGGYRLSRPPNEIKVGQVIRQLEGRMVIKQPEVRPNPTLGQRATELVTSRLTHASEQVLDALTLQELLEEAQREQSVGQEMYHI